MTIQTLVLIILILFGIVLFGGLIFVIYLLGKRSIKNNPNKALIFIKNGNNVEKPLKGCFHEESKEGVSYKYGNGKTILIPISYGEVYCMNKRMVFINHIGQLIALPFDKDTHIGSIKSANLIYEICASHVGADGMRALKGKSTASIILVALVAFALGAVIVFVTTQFMDMQQTKQPTTNVTEQQRPTQTPIEVK